jgi:3-hydroxyisobutyrate dehydrogenase-like beta-hydroxyacid dehydrogenase
VARAIKATGADLLYVDANAIAPRTVKEIGEIVGRAGARVADVGIVGAPPRQPGTRFYTSGPGAEEFASLVAYGLDVRIVGDEVGQASGFKMCYAALTKGLTALGVELLVAARLMGLEDALRAEHRESMSGILSWLERQVPSMPPKAYRWVGEMEEIAQCFADLGLTPNILMGAAEMYRLVTDTAIGRETPENRDRSRDLDGVIAALANAVTVGA